MVKHHDIGDDGIDGPLRIGDLRLAHAVTDHFAAAEFDLLAIGGEVFLDLDHQRRVGQMHAVSGSGAEHVGIGAACQCCSHDDSLP